MTTAVETRKLSRVSTPTKFSGLLGCGCAIGKQVSMYAATSIMASRWRISLELLSA